MGIAAGEVTHEQRIERLEGELREERQRADDFQKTCEVQGLKIFTLSNERRKLESALLEQGRKHREEIAALKASGQYGVGL